LDDLIGSFTIILKKVLQNFSIVADKAKYNLEIDGFAEQMIILSIFNFHFNLNGLKEYKNDSTKIIRPKKETNTNNSSDENFLERFLYFSIYDHAIVNTLKELIDKKNNIKISYNFLKELIRVVIFNFNEDNILFTEKVLVIILYWLSINYDLYQLIIEPETKKELKCLNFILQESNEFKELKKDKNSLVKKIEQINTMILPIETILHVISSIIKGVSSFG
jgi:hypothetical protein